MISTFNLLFSVLNFNKYLPTVEKRSVRDFFCYYDDFLLPMVI